MTNLSVLVVDDDPRLRNMLVNELSKRYQAAGAADGSEALAMARIRPPDVVVTDVLMPNVDGHALCRTLRSESTFRTTSIVVMSGRSGTDAIVQALEVGADDCISKPFEIRELIARIDAQVRARRMERSLVERETRLAAIGTLASSVVHDVRNGLTALLARADFARAKGAEDHGVERDLTIIEGLAVRLNRNLQDILDFARGDDLLLKRKPTLVPELFQRLHDELSGTFEHGGVTLVFTYDGDVDIPINIDADRLQRAIENVLLNARTAAIVGKDQPRRVEATVHVAPDELHIDIDDTGEGIAPEHLQSLFQVFSAHGKTGNTGLGLSTVRNVLRAHGGEAHVMGHGPLGGARFHLWLPNVAATKSAEPVAR